MMALFYRSLGIFIILFEFLVIIRILFSFLNLTYNSSVGRFVYELTEPLLGLSRDLIAKLGINTGMFDFSPILSILILRLIYAFLRRILF